MSDYENYLSNWQPPKDETGNGRTLKAVDMIWLISILLAILVAESFNWLLHTANYSLVNTVGSDVFLLDILGLPPLRGIQDITVGTLINGVLGLAAVATPVFLFSQLLERHEELFDNPEIFVSHYVQQLEKSATKRLVLT